MSDEGESRTSPFLLGLLALAVIAVAALGYEGVAREGFAYCWFHRCCPRGSERCDHRPPRGDVDGWGADDNTPARERTADELARLRRAAWRSNDFWAQMELGDIYSNIGKPDYDPIEAYVWYFLASINPQARTDAEAYDYDSGSYPYRATQSALIAAQRSRASIAELFSSGERDWARDRIVYVLACRGPSGFALLGELYSPWSPVQPQTDSYADSAGRGDEDSRRGDRDRDRDRSSDYSDEDDVAPEPVRPIAKDDYDAMLYYDLADRAGGGISNRYREYARRFEKYLTERPGEDEARGEAIVKQASEDAARWHLPFDSAYPGESEINGASWSKAAGTSGGNGAPLTDECGGSAEYEASDSDDEPIPFWDVQEALWALNYVHTPPTKAMFDPESREIFNAVRSYQRDRGMEPTGWLTIHQQLQLVTDASKKNDPASEIALGKIYVTGTIQSVPDVANGDGEVLWQQVARDPRNGDWYRGMALYNLAQIYQNGYGSVPADARLAAIYGQGFRNLKFDPRRGPPDLIADPEILARDREAVREDPPHGK